MEEQYFNFPIQLLEDFLTNDMRCLNNICDYAVYKHSLTYLESRQEDRIKLSASSFSLTMGSVKNTARNAKNILSIIPDKSPMVGINITIFWDFYKNDKTEFEKVCLLGFLAFKSILGDKGCCKTTNKYWFSRMSGSVKSVEIESMHDVIQKYHTRRYQTKIKTALENNWGLKEYSFHTRGFYISFRLSIDDLVKYAEDRRESTKEKQLKQAKKDARNKYKRGVK